jgi:hypothetical protein
MAGARNGRRPVSVVAGEVEARTTKNDHARIVPASALPPLSFGNNGHWSAEGPGRGGVSFLRAHRVNCQRRSNASETSDGNQDQSR